MALKSSVCSMLLAPGQIWLQLWYKESTTKHDEEKGVGQNGEQRDGAQNCKTEKSRTKISMELLPENGQDLFKTKVLNTDGRWQHGLEVEASECLCSVLCCRIWILSSQRAGNPLQREEQLTSYPKGQSNNEKPKDSNNPPHHTHTTKQ